MGVRVRCFHSTAKPVEGISSSILMFPSKRIAWDAHGRGIRRKAAEKLELDDERLRLELLSFAPAQPESTAQMSLSKVGQQNITT
jgi:hypothetical protein